MESLECPRCSLPLSPDSYEKIPVLVCRECWGYWLDKGDFGKIATSREFLFTEPERKTVMERARGRTSSDEASKQQAPLSCARCKKTMQKLHFNVQAPITLDRCDEHGIWLDTHELKLAQVLAEDAAAVRQLFFQKLSE